MLRSLPAGMPRTASVDSSSTVVASETSCLGLYLECQESVKTALEDPSSSNAARSAQMTVILMITCSTFCVIAETVPEWELKHKRKFERLEVMFTFFFSVELLVRLWIASGPVTCEKLLAYALDFLATIPWYLDYIFRHLYSVPSELYFREEADAFQVLRLVRVLRVLKAARHSETIATIMNCVWASIDGLMALLAFISIATVISATAVFFAEFQVPDSLFASIPASLWWALPTITGVGYGDLTPVTPAGRTIGAITMVSGLLITALVGAIMTSPVLEMYEKKMHLNRISRKEGPRVSVQWSGCNNPNLQRSGTRSVSLPKQDIMQHFKTIQDIQEQLDEVLVKLTGALTSATVSDAALDQKVKFSTLTSLSHLTDQQKLWFRHVRQLAEGDALQKFLQELEPDSMQKLGGAP